MYPEEVTYSKGLSEGPDPHGRVSDPCTYNPDLRVRPGTPKQASRTTWMGFEPLRVRSGPLSMRSWDSRLENILA
jgi:hypothetical protein